MRPQLLILHVPDAARHVYEHPFLTAPSTVYNIITPAEMSLHPSRADQGVFQPASACGRTCGAAHQLLADLQPNGVGKGGGSEVQRAAGEGNALCVHQAKGQTHHIQSNVQTMRSLSMAGSIRC